MDDLGFILIFSLFTFLILIVIYTKQERLIRSVKKLEGDLRKFIDEKSSDLSKRSDNDKN